MTAKAERITVDLDQPGHRGVVIGQHDGQIIFVRGGLPGEEGVEVLLDEQSSGKQRFRTGQALKVDSPSQHRRDGECEAAAAGAGCCDLDFVDAEGSLNFKRDVVLDQFARLGKIPLGEAFLEERTKTTSLWPFTHYRARVRLGVNKDGQAGLRKAKSNTIIPLAEAECAQWLPGLVDGVASEKFTPGSEIFIGIGRGGRRSIVERQKARRGRRRKVLEGNGTVLQSHLGVQWDIPVDAFWQGHISASAHYAKWVQRALGGVSGQVWDLYGGCGALTAGLLGTAQGITVVDVANSATSAGKAAFAQAENTGNESADGSVSFISSDVKKWLERSQEQNTPEAVILDPPRTGAGEAVIQQIAQRGPQLVAHIGCDPATAARDVGLWRDNGYELRELEIVDAFGLTHHVETLMLLEQSKD